MGELKVWTATQASEMQGAWANEVRRANRAEEALRDMVQQAEAACARLNKAENRHNQDPNGDTAPYFVDMRLAGPVLTSSDENQALTRERRYAPRFC